MIILISPAKNLKFDRDYPPITPTKPLLASEANRLANIMREKTPRDLSRLMKLSDNLSQLNHKRFKAFSLRPASNQTCPAIMAFNGDVYQGLDAASLTPADLDYAQDHLRILSGLYGILRPFDAMQPYRLEMGTRLKNDRGATLYDFWGDRPSKLLRRELRQQKAPVIINLASDEYFSVIDKNVLDAPIITPSFKEIKEGKARALSFFLKRARGLMARWIIENRIENPERLKEFNLGSYRYDKKASTPERLIFTRKQPKPVQPKTSRKKKLSA